MHKLLALFLTVLFASGCSKQLMIETVSTEKDISSRSVQSTMDRIPCNCSDPEHYVPRPELAVFENVKYVNTAYVFPAGTTGQYNWQGEEAVEYAKHLNRYSNEKLGENLQMQLPVDNNTEIHAIPWRYSLLESEESTSGYAVYEVRDDTLGYFISTGKAKNNYSTKVLRKYERHKGEALNVFSMVHHPDSLSSTKYNTKRVGIALGGSVKIASKKHSHYVKNWDMATLYNHEVGHVMGLRHSWYKNDGCDDTPPHANCYQVGTGACAGTVSNNMMDYNNSQLALTPCQIGIATKNLHTEGSIIRPLLVKDWCRKEGDKLLVVRDSLHIDRAIDAKGDIMVGERGTLMLSCRVHMPTGSSIKVAPGGHLILNGCKIHNDCGEQWEGIQLIDLGDKKAKLTSYGDVTIEGVAESK